MPDTTYLTNAPYDFFVWACWWPFSPMNNFCRLEGGVSGFFDSTQHNANETIPRPLSLTVQGATLTVTTNSDYPLEVGTSVYAQADAQGRPGLLTIGGAGVFVSGGARIDSGGTITLTAAEWQTEGASIYLAGTGILQAANADLNLGWVSPNGTISLGSIWGQAGMTVGLQDSQVTASLQVPGSLVLAGGQTRFERVQGGTAATVEVTGTWTLQYHPADNSNPDQRVISYYSSLWVDGYATFTSLPNISAGEGDSYVICTATGGISAPTGPMTLGGRAYVAQIIDLAGGGQQLQLIPA